MAPKSFSSTVLTSADGRQFTVRDRHQLELEKVKKIRLAPRLPDLQDVEQKNMGKNPTYTSMISETARLLIQHLSTTRPHEK